MSNNNPDKSFLSVDMASPYGFVESTYSQTTSISKHALANGCNVFGIKESTNDVETTSIKNILYQIKWETSFHPHQVQEVVSTNDGLIIAVATDDGSISLLNGMNGSLISSRKMMENDIKDNDSFSLSRVNPSSMKIQFISSCQKYNNKDALFILQSPSLNNTFDSPSHTAQPSNNPILIVSGMDSSLLTSTNTATLQYAAGSMSIDGLSFDGSDDMSNDNPIGALNGIFIGTDMIRFLACCTDGKLMSYDYSLTDKNVYSSQSVLLQNSCIDYEVGVKVDTNCEICDLFVVTGTSSSNKTINWISVSNLDITCEYSISNRGKNKSSDVLALEPIQSCCAQSAIAVAVAIQETTSSDESNISIRIIQAIIERNDTYGESSPETDQILISKSHTVCNIPIYQGYAINYDGISIANVNGKYSFKYIIANDESSQECNEFLTSKTTGPQIAGKFRMLLAQGLFDEADNFIVLNADNLSDDYETIHSSEVALWRLKDLLSQGNVSSKGNISTAQECLKRLASAAVTGGDVGVCNLLNASKSVSTWPVTQENNEEDIPYIGEFSLALNVLSKTLANAIKSAPTNHVASLEDEKSKIDLQIETIRVLEEVLFTDNSKVMIKLPYSAVHTPVELYQLLISQANFSGAERARRLERGRSITIHGIAESVSLVPKTINPMLYRNWLENFVIAGLSVNHQLLNMIHVWACQIADEFDENGQGLRMSIVILQVC